MKLKRPLAGLAVSLAAGASLALTACGTDNNASSAGASNGGAGASAIDCANGSLTSQGSTAQKNAMDQWIKAYQQACSGAQINYQGTGSGAGQQAFISGTADFAGSDSALKPEDQPKADARCKSGPAIHLPMVVGPIAVAYNVQGVKDLQLKPETVAGIFNNKIKKWDDPAIKADNPNAQLPSTNILAVHRSDSSGTTDNFTGYLKVAAGSAWTYDKGKEWKAPGGQAEKGNDGVGAAITRTDGAIGYVEWSFAQVNNLPVAKIYNGAGEYTELTNEAAGKTIASAEQVGTGNDLALKIDYATKAPGAYPIVLVTYEIVCEKGNPSDKLNLLKSFLTYTSGKDGQASVTQLGYAPLPEEVRTKVTQVVSSLG